VNQELIQDFNDPSPVELFYDEEWMAVVRSTYKLLTIWDKIPRFFIWNEAHK
jgi:lariat debranching enzyme